MRETGFMPDPSILKTFPVGDVTMSLMRKGGTFFLARAGGEPIELTPEQATQLYSSTNRVFSTLMNSGLSADDLPDTDTYSPRHLLPTVQGDTNAVLVDTSTLNGASISLEAGQPLPLCLLDLGTLTAALLLYDIVIVQPGSKLSVPGEFRDVIVPVIYPDHKFVSERLWTIYANTDNRTRVSGDLTLLEKRWGEFLGVKDVSLELSSLDKYQDSPEYWNGMFAHTYMGDAVWPTMTGPDKAVLSKRDEFLSIQTMRALFNDQFAGYLEIPYLASSLRTPVQDVILGRKMQGRLVADQLMATLGPPLAPPPLNDGSPYMAQVSAPFMLGLILEKMSTPSDYWRVVDEYRERFAPLRKKLRIDRDEWQDRPTEYIRDLLQPLGEAARSPGKTVDAAMIAVGFILTSPLQDPGFILPAIQMARLLTPVERLRRMYFKRFKPAIHLMFSVVDEARSLRTVDRQVASVWGREWTREEIKALEFIASRQAPDFSKLRSLGT